MSNLQFKLGALINASLIENSNNLDLIHIFFPKQNGPVEPEQDGNANIIVMKQCSIDQAKNSFNVEKASAELLFKINKRIMYSLI